MREAVGGGKIKSKDEEEVKSRIREQRACLLLVLLACCCGGYGAREWRGLRWFLRSNRTLFGLC